MSTARCCGWVLVLAAMPALAGCGGGATLHREAEATYRHLAAAEPRASAPAPEAAGPVLYFAPRDAAAEPTAGADATAPDARATEAGNEGGAAAVPFATIKGRPLGEILKGDLASIPSGVGRGLKHTYAKPENLIVLGMAFGADRIVRYNLDSQVREDFRSDDTSMAETGDFGSIVGNPALHFGLAGAWYLAAVRNGDDDQYAKSKTLVQALMVNGLSTVLLKVSMNDRSPNGEPYGWPSGHTSSSVCFAAVLHEYYGLKAGLPLYLLAGYSAATRLEDREHDLSDLVFGAALGWVIGHSVARGELPQVAGFHVLPYGGPGAGGLMLLKRW
ncbi:MAG TPA: phosphatase PAP2 family protein [Phycisphaerae bacterium]|nr:phosphatase PAP2 family protein [Phycisphaerae bacterium]